jgi:regulator of sigma E protease
MFMSALLSGSALAFASLADFSRSAFWLFVVLGVLVFVHELGHFLAAKFFKVRVEQFALGFGTRLFGVKRGGTDYRVNLLPLGGYVKMAGENPFDSHSNDPGEFVNHPRWQRFVIAIAGPFMNIVLAVALLTGMYMVNYEHADFEDQPVVVASVQPGSAAEQAGLQPGDKILRAGSMQNPTWKDLVLNAAISPGQPIQLSVERGNEILVKSIVPVATGKDKVGTLGLIPNRPAAITQVQDGPAKSAGIKSGDEPIAVNGTPVRSPDQFIAMLQKSGTTPTQITLLRGSQKLDVTVTPYYDPNNSNHYRIGIGLSDKMHSDKLAFPQALSASLDDNRRYSGLLLQLVERLLQRKAHMDQLSSPIGIGAALGQAAKEGRWKEILSQMSFISLQLGIINLFPFPILDGGMVLLLVIEALMRRDISMRIKERVYQVAFVAIVLFFAVVVYNDLTKIVPGMGRP